MEICVGCTTGINFRNSEYAFTFSCGVCFFWKLKCGGMLTCADLSLVFSGLVLYFTEKLDNIIPDD